MYPMEDHLHYARAHNAFHKNSNLIECTLSWIRQNMPGIVKEILDSGTIKGKGQFQIISIGSGKGFQDAAILDEVMKFPLKIKYTAVDPSGVSMKQFEKNVANNPKYAEVEFDLCAMKAEDYLSSKAPNRKFHLVLFIHSLYFFYERIGEVLKDVYNLTDEEGCIVAHTSKKEGVYAIGEGKLPIDGTAWANDIDTALDNEKFACKQTEFQYCIDLEPIVECSAEGNLLLDFLTLSPNFRETSKPEFVKEIVEKLINMAKKKNNKPVGCINVKVHIIHKRR